MIPPALGIDARTRLVVLTGAGISAESGLATFRGGDGLWDGHPVAAVATPEGFAADPRRVWSFYAARRRAATAAGPNAAHLALAACEARTGDRLLLVTQNVDGLHQRAGSRRVEELHGSLWMTRCADCAAPAFPDRAPHPAPPACPSCGGRLRPAIVWFGEPVEAGPAAAVTAFLGAASRAGDRLVFLAVGTSGSVWPASALVRLARAAGAETWLANLEPADNAGDFEHVVLGAATTLVPALLG